MSHGEPSQSQKRAPILAALQEREESEDLEEGRATVTRTVRFAIALLVVGIMVPVVSTVSMIPMSSCALAASCADRCYARENACRRRTKDSPECGKELTQCLKNCVAQRQSFLSQ